MDANVLLECFSATLQTDHTVLVRAEEQLRILQTTPGFLGGCLDIIASDSSLVNDSIKKAAAVYLKNRIVRYWNYESPLRIDDGERPIVKERILNVITVSDYKVKQQLIPVLRVLVSYEFNKKWPTLLQETGNLLQKVPTGEARMEDLSELYTGLLCFSEIVRKFRWVDNSQRRGELDDIITQVFPHLLNIGNLIITSGDGITEFTAEMLKLILKAYKFVTYFDMPEVLQSSESMVEWAKLHGSILMIDTPSYIKNSTMSNQEKDMLQFSKCGKWSIANLYRIFTRYASHSITKKFKYDGLREMFMENFVPHLIHNYLAIVEQWCNGDKWLSGPTLYYLIQFLSYTVTQKTTWGLIKPYFENLVSHLIYPLLIPSDETLETFENDPHEYVHANIEIFNESDAAAFAALGLLVTLIDKRKRTTLEPIVTFAYNQLSELQGLPETLEVAKKKDGAMRLFGSISHYLVIPQSPYYSEMEKFLANLIFPNLVSQYDFLKARALEVSSKFADLEFEDEKSLSFLFHSILSNFENSNSCLPVSLHCALAIQAFLPLERFQEVLGTIIVPTMSKLLDLSNEIDNDAISAVMQECVENFSEQLQPFGIHLMTKLVEQFLRLASEINIASNTDVDEFDSEYEDQSDKVMAAIGLLNTMITILLSFENSIDICHKLEEVIFPAIEFVLANKLHDFLTEVGELIENCTFLLRSISPLMWKNFDLLYEAFNDGIAIMYMDELNQCLQNFLIYGQDDVLNDKNKADKFFGIFRSIIQGDPTEIGYKDIIDACELVQSFILALKHNCTPYIADILNGIFHATEDSGAYEKKGGNTSYNVNTVNAIVSLLVYHPATTLLHLQKCDKLVYFFERFFRLIPSFERVYDTKLAILGILGLMSNNDALNLLTKPVIDQLAFHLTQLLQRLPKAIETLQEKRVAFNHTAQAPSHGANADGFEDLDFADPDDGGDELGGSADTTENASTTEYLDFLQQENEKLKSSGFFDEDDDRVVEDPLSSSALENFDVLGVFSEFFRTLRESHPQKHTILFGSLPPDTLAVLSQAAEISQ